MRIAFPGLNLSSRTGAPPVGGRRPLSPIPPEDISSGPANERAVAYDDLKQHEGRLYSGMAVGGRHVWEYTGGLWDERKAAPDRWDFTFSSVKRRTRSAPEGSGVPPGSQYHWYILAHQKVRKLDADAYETFMEGVKYKVAHKRPHWRNWSSEYPDNEPERSVVARILEGELAKLRPG
jgi:hypothetical protein